MATSGSTTWQLDRDGLVKAAMRKIAALAKGQTPDTEDYTNGTIALNGLVAQYQVLGMHLWKRAEYSVPLVAGQISYNIGVGQAINTPFPLKIHEAILEDSASDSQIDVEILSVYDFLLLPQNSSSGSPVNITYQPFVNRGVIRVWPTPDATAAATKTLKIVYESPVEDFVTATDNPDFPKEWHNALIYGLAVLLAPEYGVPLDDRRQLQKEHDTYLQTAVDSGVEQTSMFFQIDRM